VPGRKYIGDQYDAGDAGRRDDRRAGSSLLRGVRDDPRRASVIDMSAAGVGLVIEHVHCTVAHLNRIDVAGERPRRMIFGNEAHAVLSLQGIDIGRREPDWDLDRNRYRVVDEHEAL
jgi:hypothetical protein